MEVFYRWHALYGRRFRRQYSERRVTGELVHIEVKPGVVVVLAAWMLDAGICAAMELGPSRASMSALADLHQLLCELGYRRSFYGAVHTDYEEPHDPPAKITSGAASSTPLDRSMPIEHCVRVPGTRGNESQPTSQCHQSTGHAASAGSRTSIAGGNQ